MHAAVIVLVILGLVVAIAGVLLMKKTARRLGQTRTAYAVTTTEGCLGEMVPVANSSQIARLRQDLRVKVLYDEAIIDRLVEFERQRMGGVSEIRAYQAAIERWERDNR